MTPPLILPDDVAISRKVLDLINDYVYRVIQGIETERDAAQMQLTAVRIELDKTPYGHGNAAERVACMFQHQKAKDSYIAELNEKLQRAREANVSPCQIAETVRLREENAKLRADYNEQRAVVIEAHRAFDAHPVLAECDASRSTLSGRAADLIRRLDDQARTIRENNPFMLSDTGGQIMRDEIAQLKSTLTDKNLQIIALQSYTAPRLNNRELLADLQERLRKAAADANIMRGELLRLRSVIDVASNELRRA